MRAATAYFIGAGSIVAAIAVGLGGGIVAGNIMHPIAPKQGPDTGQMAQRAEPAAIATTTSAPLERVQYLTGSQTFGAMIAAQAQDDAKSDVKPDAQANAEPTPPQTAAQIAAAEPAPADQQASTQPASSPDNAYAKARDSDVKRAASERRRAERHQRWAERRHYDTRDARGMRDQTNWNTNWDDVARNVRQDSDARYGASRPRSGFSQMRLFGNDAD